jgi:EAL domain-containing protein (putative c-di-GMP-specific phosphodiesterase class I)
MPYVAMSHLGNRLQEIEEIYNQVSEHNHLKFILVKFHHLGTTLLKAYGFNYIAEIHKQVKSFFVNRKNMDILFISFLSLEYLFVICKNDQSIEKEIIKELNNKFSFCNKNFLISISAVNFTNNRIKCSDILHKMLQDKVEYSEISSYETNQLPDIENLVSLEIDRATFLKNCFSNNENKIFFQPIFDSKEDKFIYYECLLRIYEENKLRSAAEYIISAEKLELSHFIDSAVLENIPIILDKYPDKTFSFNLSANIIFNNNLKTRLKNIFTNKNYSSRSIIEITETFNYTNLELILNFILELKKLGAKIAIDDFGVGFTNLAQLKYLPIDIVKIDGAFIKDILYNETSRCFTDFIVNYAKYKNIDVVAEFVESKEIKNYLDLIGVHKMQGYFFGEPLEIPMEYKKT